MKFPSTRLAFVSPALNQNACDAVAGDQIAGVGRRLDEEAACPSRDDPVRSRRRPADRVARGAGEDLHAGTKVGQRGGAVHLGADKVALDHVTRPAGGLARRWPRRCPRCPR